MLIYFQATLNIRLVPLPNQTPVVSYPVPVIADRVLLEFWNTTLSDYVALDPGAPHPNTRDFSGYKLGKQDALPSDEKIIRRVWVTDATNENLYNYALKYSAQSASHPLFIRSYRVRKDNFTPIARGTALQTVYRIALTAAGSGYTAAAIAALSGGAGSGAAARVVLNHDGTVAEVVLTAGGDSYTSAPTVAISDTGGGSGATATAYIQPTSAVLVEEEPQQFDPGSEYYGLYFNVIRVWQTLPGPTLTGTSLDKFGGRVTSAEHEIASGTALAQGGYLVAGDQVEPVSSVVDKRSRQTVTGYPILTDWVIDPEANVPVKLTHEVIDIGQTKTASSVVTSGTITIAAHNFTSGNAAQVAGSFPASSPPLTAGGEYWVGVLSSTTIRLFTSQANAAANTSPVTFTANGAASFTVRSSYIAAPSVTVGIDVEINSLDDFRAIRTRRVFNPDATTGLPTALSGGTALVRYRPVQFTFPALLETNPVLDTGNPSTFAVSSSGDVSASINPKIRSAYRRAVTGKVTTSYGTGFTPDAELLIKPQDIRHSGPFFDLAISNVLNDDFVLVVAVTGNPKWGDFTDGISVADSTPSYTDYLALVSGVNTGNVPQYQTISCEIRPWRYNLDRKESIGVKME